MRNYNSNMIFIGRPTEKDIRGNSCNSCSGNSTECPPDIGPRPNRERVKEEIRDYVLNMLGAPQVQIELDQQNLDFAVNQSMKYVEEFAPRDFFSYYVIDSVPGKSVYKMPPDIGAIRNVYYKTQPRQAFNANDLGGAIPLSYFTGGNYSGLSGGFIDPTQPVWGNMGEWVAYKSYEQMYSQLSGQIGGWEWVNDHQHIKIYPTPCGCDRIIIHYLQKCKDWQEVLISMQEGALAYAKQILGRIRSKYEGSYGPANSGLRLDGTTLLQEANEELRQWKEDLINKWGDLFYITSY